MAGIMSMKKRLSVPRKYDWRKDAVKVQREERMRELMEGLGVSVPTARVDVEKELSKGKMKAWRAKSCNLVITNYGVARNSIDEDSHILDMCPRRTSRRSTAFGYCISSHTLRRLEH